MAGLVVGVHLDPVDPECASFGSLSISIIIWTHVSTMVSSLTSKATSPSTSTNKLDEMRDPMASDARADLSASDGAPGIRSPSHPAKLERVELIRLSSDSVRT